MSIYSLGKNVMILFESFKVINGQNRKKLLYREVNTRRILISSKHVQPLMTEASVPQSLP